MDAYGKKTNNEVSFMARILVVVADHAERDP